MLDRSQAAGELFLRSELHSVPGVGVPAGSPAEHETGRSIRIENPPFQSRIGVLSFGRVHSLCHRPGGRNDFPGSLLWNPDLCPLAWLNVWCLPLIAEHNILVSVVVQIEKPHSVIAAKQGGTQCGSKQQILIQPLVSLFERQE